MNLQLKENGKEIQKSKKERIHMNLQMKEKDKELEKCKKVIIHMNKQIIEKNKELKNYHLEQDKELKAALQNAKKESQQEQQKIIDRMQEINDVQVLIISAYKEEHLGHGAHSRQTTTPENLVFKYQWLTDLQDQTIKLLYVSSKKQ